MGCVVLWECLRDDLFVCGFEYPIWRAIIASKGNLSDHKAIFDNSLLHGAALPFKLRQAAGHIR